MATGNPGGHYREGAGGKPYQWQRGVGGEWVMPELQSLYLDWLLSEPKEPKTLQEWADWHQVGVNTVRGWHKDPRFKEEHRKRLYERAVDPEQLQPVLESMHKIASTMGDMAAVKQYMTLVQQLMPQDPINRDPQVQLMSDEEIIAELHELLGAER